MFSSSSRSASSASPTLPQTKSKSLPSTPASAPAMVAPIPVSPPSPSSRRRSFGGVAGVANMLVKMRRSSLELRTKTKVLECASGVEPKTHPGLPAAVNCSRIQGIAHTDVFVCIGGVNVALLLRATRATMMEFADMLGANVLVDEQWSCTITGPANKSNGSYKVQIHYSASATRADTPDPHKPVALECAKGVPGLMTIIKRED